MAFEYAELAVAGEPVACALMAKTIGYIEVDSATSAV